MPPSNLEALNQQLSDQQTLIEQFETDAGQYETKLQQLMAEN